MKLSWLIIRPRRTTYGAGRRESFEISHEPSPGGDSDRLGRIQRCGSEYSLAVASSSRGGSLPQVANCHGHRLKRSIIVAGTAGALNNRNSFQRGGYDASIWGIAPADIGHASVYLGEHFPHSRLAGKNHDVILMDDCDHAGLFGVAPREVTLMAGNGASCAWVPAKAGIGRNATDQADGPTNRRKQLYGTSSRSTPFIIQV